MISVAALPSEPEPPLTSFALVSKYVPSLAPCDGRASSTSRAARSVPLGGSESLYSFMIELIEGPSVSQLYPVAARNSAGHTGYMPSCKRAVATMAAARREGDEPCRVPMCPSWRQMLCRKPQSFRNCAQHALVHWRLPMSSCGNVPPLVNASTASRKCAEHTTLNSQSSSIKTASSILRMMSTEYTFDAHLRSFDNEGTSCSTSSYLTATSKQHIATSCSEVLGTFTLLKTRSM
mmetsp:Transcript_11629/g.48764  ORF Transcript_11629/g.48764 Transcript_11629/m.48764 type:complete len:235 (+) Transcript_11629:451-1155(+)